MGFSVPTALLLLAIFLTVVFECEKVNVEAYVFISDILRKDLQKELDSMNFAFDKRPMDKVSLTCNTKASDLVLEWHPSSSTQWKHNGGNLELKMNRMTYSLDSLSIQNLVPSDSGLYQCDRILSEQQRLTVAVYTIVVGEEPVSVYSGESLQLDCCSTTLGKLFKSATRQWWHKGKQIGSPKPASDESKDTFPSVTSEHSGIWHCETIDSKTDRKWKTARYSVTVKPPLPLLKRFRRYSKTHRKETIAMIAASCFGFVIVVNLITACLDKRQAAKNAEMTYFKQSLGWEGFEPDTASLLPKISNVDEEESESESDTETSKDESNTESGSTTSLDNPT